MSGRLEQPPYFPSRVVTIGKQVDDLLPGRSVLVKQLGVDASAIYVSYEIRPPIEVLREHPVRTTWLLRGTDDTGLQYTSTGGLFGDSEDGTCTQGLVSLQPCPSPAARCIDLGFVASGDAGPDEEVRHQARVRLPPR